MSGDADFLAHLEEMGQAQVRLVMSTSGFQHPMNQVALRWLADQDRAALAAAASRDAIIASRDAAADSRANTAAERAADAAERSAKSAATANTIARIAVVIATITSAVTIVIWLLQPHH